MFTPDPMSDLTRLVPVVHSCTGSGMRVKRKVKLWRDNLKLKWLDGELRESKSKDCSRLFLHSSWPETSPSSEAIWSGAGGDANVTLREETMQ